MRGKKWTETDEKWLKTHFSDMKTREIAAKMGCSIQRVEKYAYSHGLRKSDRHIEAVRLMALQKAIQYNRTRIYDNTKNVESLKKRIKNERARIAFGLKQKTKLRLIHQAPAKILLRYRLKKAGYIIDEEERIAYYTDTTQRRLKTEKWNTRWYTFAPLPNEQSKVSTMYSDCQRKQ